jgi:hypothetical protein
MGTDKHILSISRGSTVEDYTVPGHCVARPERETFFLGFSPSPDLSQLLYNVKIFYILDPTVLLPIYSTLQQ